MSTMPNDFDDVDPGDGMKPDWGNWGGEPPCEHLLSLRNYLEDTGLSVYSEHGESPNGWVNVHCPKCHRTYGVTLQEPFHTDESEAGAFDHAADIMCGGPDDSDG